MPGMRPGDLGSCCPDLYQAVRQPDSVFRIDPNGVLHLIVGFESGTAQPMFYCPFCANALQNRRAAEDRSRGK
jgi:hypothetical protein